MERLPKNSVLNVFSDPCRGQQPVIRMMTTLAFQSGMVYRVKLDKQTVAAVIKLAPGGDSSSLNAEVDVYARLNQVLHMDALDGIREVVMRVGSKSSVLVYGLILPSFGNPLALVSMSTNRCLQFFSSAVRHLKVLHSTGRVHRRITPDHIMIKDKEVFIVSLGRCKPFWEDEFDKVHKKLTTTDDNKITDYSSQAEDVGFRSTRKDDLQSLGYCFISQLKAMNGGHLPWSDVQLKQHEEAERKGEKIRIKLTTEIDQLCNDCPLPVAKYMKMVDKLCYCSTPKYDALAHIIAN